MIIVRNLGIQPYVPIWRQMQDFTSKRHAATSDELWLLQHEPVYTQGQAGKAEHLLNNNLIPVIQSDRGGQITYHAPGQLIAYVLLDLRRLGIGVKSLVSKLEKLIIDVLAQYAILGRTKCLAPGVYVTNKKIASIGLRIKNVCTYHGIALNVNLDLTPFQNINPCGFQDLIMTQINDYMASIQIAAVAENLRAEFINSFG